MATGSPLHATHKYGRTVAWNVGFLKQCSAIWFGGAESFRKGLRHADRLGHVHSAVFMVLFCFTVFEQKQDRRRYNRLCSMTGASPLRRTRASSSARPRSGGSRRCRSRSGLYRLIGDRQVFLALAWRGSEKGGGCMSYFTHLIGNLRVDRRGCGEFRRQSSGWGSRPKQRRAVRSVSTSAPRRRRRSAPSVAPSSF